MSTHRFIDRETGKPISEKQLRDEVAAILRESFEGEGAAETEGGSSDTPPYREGGIIPKTGGIAPLPWWSRG